MIPYNVKCNTNKRFVGSINLSSHKNKQDLSFGITGNNEFEIEDVGLCGGILYFNTNCDGRSDLLGKINGYVAAE